MLDRGLYKTKKCDSESKSSCLFSKKFQRKDLVYSVDWSHQKSIIPDFDVNTFKVWVEQLLPGIAKQSVGEDKVERTQQQMIRVDQVITDHWEVP